MNASKLEKAEKIIYEMTLSLALLGGGFVLVYLLAWLFETPAPGESLMRWSSARCGWAVMVSAFAYVCFWRAHGERP